MATMSALAALEPIEPTSMSMALVVGLLLLGLLMGAATFLKVRHIRQSLFRVQDRLSPLEQTFRQIETLQALYIDLRLDRSLPATRGWAASPDFLAVLARHVLATRPSVIVECGSGVSTVVLARCCELNKAGHVYSLEHHAGYADTTRAELTRHELSHRADVLASPLVPHELAGERWSWYAVNELPDLEIDTLVIDGPPGHTGPLARYPAGPVLLRRLRVGGVAFLDDGHEAHVKQALARWSREIPGLATQSVECEKGCLIVRRERS
jgi:predicted O-methyltransferase YrrM